LIEEVKTSLLNAYDQIGKAINSIELYSNIGLRDGGVLFSQAREQVKNSAPHILDAKSKLQKYIQSEN
jgi:hypothetical protein